MLRILSVCLALSASSACAQDIADVPYGRHKDQRLDVYLPERPQNAPTIVMLHGGAWRIGDKSNRQVWKAKSEYWGAKGFIFVSVNTRLLPDADPLEQTRDLAQALALVQKRSATWGGDPDRIVLMGHSAGAHVAALLATRRDLQREASVVPWKGTVVLDSAMLDVAGKMRDDPPRLYRRAFGSDPRFWTAASPMEHADSGDGPFLIVCSTRRPAPCPDGRVFAELSGRTSILPVDLSHGEINGELGKPSAYTRAIDAWIARALSR